MAGNSPTGSNSPTGHNSPAVSNNSPVAGGNSPATGLQPPLTGLKYWVRGDSAAVGAGTVSAWPDLAGSGITVVPNATQPVFSATAVRGKPAVTFSGAELLRASQSPLAAGNTPRTVFVVAVIPQLGGCLMCIGKDGGWFGPSLASLGTSGSFCILRPAGFGGTITDDTTPYISVPVSLEYTYNGVGGAVSVSANGNAFTLSGNTAGTDSNDFLTIGNYWNVGPGGLPGHGDIAEILVYDHVLSAPDLALARAYIDSRYLVYSNAAIVPYGDSITFGAGATTLAGYEQPLLTGLTTSPNLMSRGTAQSPQGTNADRWHYNAGYGGLSTTTLLSQVNGTATGGAVQFLFRGVNANTLLLHAGANDPGASITPATSASNLLAIAQQFLTDKPSGKVFVMKTLFGRSDSASLNAFVTSVRPLIVTAFTGVPNTVIVSPPTIPDGGYSDGVHPNDTGYTLMADDGSGNGWAPSMRANGF